MTASIGLNTMASSMEHADNYNKWMFQIFYPFIGNDLLEIGTGYGNFRKYLPSLNQYVSIDIDAEVIARAQEMDKAAVYLTADMADTGTVEKLKKFNFDTVLCVNVLEHIENDEQAIVNMLSLLKDGGHLLLFVPAFHSLYTSLDKLAGHYRRYTKKDIGALIDGPDYHIERLEYFNPIGGVGWWLNKFMRHDNIDSKGINMQVKLFDSFIVPISRKVNIFTKSFFGQSLICVMRKK